MFAQSTSLHRSLTLRLLGALGIALAVASVCVALAAQLISSAVSRQQLNTASAHFQTRISDIEESWQVQADAFRSQLVVSRVLEEPDERLLQARLTAFATALGGEGMFTHVVLVDAGHRVLHHSRTRSQQDLAVPTVNTSPTWEFGARDQTLYRVLSLPVALARGGGRLILYAPLDNALLARNVYPNTAVTLLWNGKEIAASPHLASAGDPVRPPITATRLMNWSAAGGEPQVRVERRVVLPLTLAEALAIVVCALLALGLLAWLGLGRWLAHQSRRIVALEHGTAAFVTDQGVSETVLRGLAQAEDGRTDEVAKLARAARKAMQTTLRQDQQLQRDQQRFRDIAEMSSDWFWEQDADFRFTYMSEELMSISGVPTGSTLGKTRWELPIQGVSEDAWAAHRALLDRHVTFRDFEYQILNDADELRWSSISGKPVFDAEGQFTGYRGTGRDITERKEAEIALREREQRLRALIELSSDWYWEQDTEHRLTLREGGVLRRAGLPASRDLGKTHWEIGYVNMTEADWAAHRALLERREEFRDLLLGRRSPDGRLLWGSLSGRPRYAEDGSFIGYHGVGRGVTALVDAERAMRESMAELRLIMENAPVSVGYFDRDLVLRFVNRGFERLWQRDAASLVGQHLRDIAGDDAYRVIEPHFAGALLGNAASYRRINNAPGAAVKTLDVSVVPHRDDAGNVVGCYGIGMDVTGMVQAEEEVRSLQHLFTSTFQNTTDLMAIYRVDGDQLIIEGFNQALWRFYEARFPDVRMADWAGRPIDAFLREVTHLTQEQCDTRLIPFWKAVRHARLERYQTDLPTPAGAQRRDTLLVPIINASGAVTHLFYRGADITDLMKKEQELQALNTELEHKVAARTADLSAANRELEAFAYAVSHDLRTPLRGIDGFSRLLAEEYGATLGPSGISHLQRIRHGIQRMGDLIDDLLRLSRVTRGPLVRSPVDLSALAAEIGAELARQAPARDIEWRIQPGVNVSADPGLMRLLLDNLLGNAFKYSRHVVHAVIEFGAAPVPDGIEFWVRDNGAGFDMAYAGKLFQPFQRLHGPKEFEGTGVGLATVHRIVSRHGGTIEAYGETGKGARFRIVLPLPQEGP